MSTRNVVLTEHHEHVIETLVKSGRYQNASEVMREGLRLVEHREAAEAAKLEALRDASRIGFADIDEGRYQEIDDDQLDTFLSAIAEQAGKLANTGKP